MEKVSLNFVNDIELASVFSTLQANSQQVECT